MTKTKFKTPRRCAICDMYLPTDMDFGLTAHEFECYKAHKDQIPKDHFEAFRHAYAGEIRSNAAKRGVETRRQQGGKRAPRKHVKTTFRY